MITWIALIALGLLLLTVLVALGAWALQTASRLNRLHVRYDLSWQALDGALGRRAVVARAVATSGSRHWPSPRNGRPGRPARPPRTSCLRH